MTRIFLLLVIFFASLCSQAHVFSEDISSSDIHLTLGPVGSGHKVPKTLWGLFFEDINWTADGGLNPEMLANGGFDWLQVIIKTFRAKTLPGIV